MSGSQGSRGVTLLARFAASGVASATVRATESGLLGSGGLLSSTASQGSQGARSLRALFRDAAHAACGRQLSTAAAASAAGAGSGAGKRCSGMILSTGILSRCLATTVSFGGEVTRGAELKRPVMVGSNRHVAAHAHVQDRTTNRGCASPP